MNNTQTSRRGSAILTVLGIVAVVSVVCAMLGASASQQTRSSQITREMLKARMIAESGLNKAYHAVKSNFDLAKGYELNEAFAGGSFTVKAMPLGSADPNRAQLQAVGVYGLGQAVVAADLENRPLALESEDDGLGDFYSLAFDLMAGGTMKLKGNFYAEVTAIHANGAADCGGSFDVGAGNIVLSSSQTAEWKKKPASVTLKSNQPAQQVFPSDLAAAFDRLKAYAEANGAVYASGAQIPASPPGGVAYCTGSDSGWGGTGTGCFIFEGTFSSKHITINGVNNYPALIVLSPSDVQFNAGTTIGGAVLLPNSSLKFNGHAIIYGPILVGQEMTGNGTADLYAGGGQGFALPPEEVETEDNVVITAWH